MFVKAWVKDPPKMPQDAWPDRRLRKFAVLAFELSRSATGEEHALIASGEQLQVSIATLRQRLSWALQLLCPPYFEYVWQAGMNTLGSYAKYSQPFEEIRSDSKLAALKVSGAGGYEGQLKIRQLNVMLAAERVRSRKGAIQGNGVGHGAATASMLCLAASEAHAEQPVLEAKFFYLSPAPMQMLCRKSPWPLRTQLLLEAKPNKNPNQFQVFMRLKKGSPPLIRGTVTLAPPPARGAGAAIPMVPMRSEESGSNERTEQDSSQDSSLFSDHAEPGDSSGPSDSGRHAFARLPDEVDEEPYTDDEDTDEDH
eukprot:g33768.t1